MKRFKKSLFLLSFLGLTLGTLVSCNNQTPPVEEEKPDPDPGEDPTPPIQEEITFEESDYQKELLGKFYSKEGTLVVEANQLTLVTESETLVLHPTKIEDIEEGEETRSCVFYETSNSKNSKDVRIHLSFGERQVLVMEELVGSTYEESITFRPSIEEFTGTYTYYGDTDPYNNSFWITDTFDSRFDAFIITQFMYGSMSSSTFYADSYFVEKGDELVKVFDLMDYVDTYLYGTYKLDVTDNKATIVDISEMQGDYQSDITYVYGTYFVDEETSLTFEYTPLTDEWGWTLGMGSSIFMEGEEFEIEYIYNNSQYLHLSNEERDIMIRPYAYGIEVTEDEVVTKYPLDYIYDFYGTYQNDEIEFEFYSDFDFDTFESFDVLEINGEVTPFKKTVYQDRLALEVVLNEEEVIFSPYVSTIALTMVKGGETSVLLDYTQFSSYLEGTHYFVDQEEVETIEVSESLEVTYKGSSVSGRLDYNPRNSYPDLMFEIEGSEYTLRIVDPLRKTYYLIGEDGETKDFVNSTIIDGLVTPFENGRNTISLDKDSMTLLYGEEELNFSLFNVYNSTSFSYEIHLEFYTQNENRYLWYAEGETLYEVRWSTDEIIDTYIPQEHFESLYGRYIYNGTYGEEAFEFTSDNRFLADTLNSTGDGLLYKQEFDYFVGMIPLATGEYCPAISFYYGGYTIYCYKEDYHLSVMGIEYVDERIAHSNGVYLSEDESSLIYINKDHVYIDGEEASVTSLDGAFSEDTSEVTISVELEGVEHTLVLEGSKTDEGVTITSLKDGETTYSLVPETEFNFDSFKGTHVSGDGYSFEFEDNLALSGAKDGYIITVISNGLEVSTIYDFDVTLYNGFISIHFSYFSTDYYIYNNGSEIVVSYSSSIPLPPPPPPAP